MEKIEGWVDEEDCNPNQDAAVKKSTWVSVVVDLMLTAQMTAGLLTKSQGLVAAGVHSLSDLIADFVVLLAKQHRQKDADEDHPYGHHRYLVMPGASA